MGRVHFRLADRLRLLCLALVVSPLAPARTPGEVPTGGVLREATLQGLNGPPRRLAEYRGRPLLINVWASWCGPCIQEMASLERLAWREDRLPFSVIGISTDDYPEKALAFLNRSNATIRHFIDHDLQMENMLGASTIPLTVLVDANGRCSTRSTARASGLARVDAADFKGFPFPPDGRRPMTPRRTHCPCSRLAHWPGPGRRSSGRSRLVPPQIERYTCMRCISIRTEGAAGRMQVASGVTALPCAFPPRWWRR